MTTRYHTVRFPLTSQHVRLLIHGKSIPIHPQLVETGVEKLLLTPRQVGQLNQQHLHDRIYKLRMSKQQVKHHLEHGGGIWDSIKNIASSVYKTVAPIVTKGAEYAIDKGLGALGETKAGQSGVGKVVSQLVKNNKGKIAELATSQLNNLISHSSKNPETTTKTISKPASQPTTRSLPTSSSTSIPSTLTPLQADRLARKQASSRAQRGSGIHSHLDLGRRIVSKRSRTIPSGLISTMHKKRRYGSRLHGENIFDDIWDGIKGAASTVGHIAEQAAPAVLPLLMAAGLPDQLPNKLPSRRSVNMQTPSRIPPAELPPIALAQGIASVKRKRARSTSRKRSTSKKRSRSVKGGSMILPGGSFVLPGSGIRRKRKSTSSKGKRKRSHSTKGGSMVLPGGSMILPGGALSHKRKRRTVKRKRVRRS